MDKFVCKVLLFALLCFFIADYFYTPKKADTYSYEEVSALFKEYHAFTRGVKNAFKSPYIDNISKRTGDNIWESYEMARKALLFEVYKDYKKTLYCDIDFSNPKSLKYPEHFDFSKLSARNNRIEIEHIVPADTFGSLFFQWTQGDELCYAEDTGPFRGRKCTELTSRLFRIMLSDMYNLYPSLGSLNGIRENKEFRVLGKKAVSEFYPCTFKTDTDSIEVNPQVMGIVARAYLYFEYQYRPIFNLTDEQRFRYWQLSLEHPVTKWECIRSYRIEKIQGRENPFTKNQCLINKMWQDTDLNK